MTLSSSIHDLKTLVLSFHSAIAMDTVEESARDDLPGVHGDEHVEVPQALELRYCNAFHVHQRPPKGPD